MKIPVCIRSEYVIIGIPREIKPLSYADRYVILIIEKGKSETHGLPSTMINYMLYSISRSLLRVVGGYFRFLKIS